MSYTLDLLKQLADGLARQFDLIRKLSYTTLKSTTWNIPSCTSTTVM